MAVSLRKRWWYPRSSGVPRTSKVDACPPRKGAPSKTSAVCPASPSS